MDQPPISDYALLSDCQGAALAGRGGASGGPLDDPPRGRTEVTRAHAPGTMVLETTWSRGRSWAWWSRGWSARDGLVRTEGGADALFLRADVPVRIEDAAVVADLDLPAGGSAAFALCCRR